MHELQDEDIISMVLQGDHNTYAMLVERYQHFVFTLVLKFIPMREDAEETAQDVFIKAYRSLSSYNGQSKFSTWLYTITRNTCLSKLRGATLPLISAETTEFPAHTTNETNELLDRRSKQEVIDRALKMLNEDDAQVLTLFYLMEQSTEEIAIITGLSIANVKVKLYRARKRMKEVLDKNFSKEYNEYK